MREPEPAARVALIRGLFIYLGFLVLDALLLWYLVSLGVQGIGYVSLIAFGGLGMLLAYQVLQYVLDLRAPLVESEGVIQRKWKRADLVLFFDSFYITVDRVVFRLQPEDWIHMEEEMYVKVVHFPHTLNVVSVHELRPSADPSTRI